MPTVDSLLIGTPKIGGTDEIYAIQSFVESIRDEAERFTLAVHRANTHLDHVSSDVTRRMSEILSDTLAPGGSTLYISTDDAVRAFRVYASEISDIHSEADASETRAHTLLDKIEAAGRRVAEVCSEAGLPFAYDWNTPPSTLMPEPLDMMNAATDSGSIVEVMRAVQRREDIASVWRDAVREWEHAVDDLEGVREHWRNLVDDRQAAELVLLRALNGTAIGEMIALAATRGTRQEEFIQAMLAGVSLGIGEGLGSRTNNRSLAQVWDDDGPRTSHQGLTRLLGSPDGSEVWISPPDADAVAASWGALSEAERTALTSEVPWVVGNLPGVPFAERDRANRRMLDYYVAHQAPLSSRAQDALAEIVRISSSSAEPPVSIVALDLGGPVPLVALGYGALDTAEMVGWGVPGMFSDADSSADSWDAAMRAQYREQNFKLGLEADHKEAAMAAFLGYDTPNLVTVLSSSSAEAGGARLAAELDGTFATRSANTPLERYGATGHSYGTTTLVEAVSQVKHPLDYVTLVASAGIDTGSAISFADLQVKRDADGVVQVFTTIAATDLLAGIGIDLSGRQQPNPQPGRQPWNLIDGAQSFSSDGSGELLAVQGHGIINEFGTGYLDMRSQSNSSTAAIAVGKIEEVSGGLTTTERDSGVPYLGPGVYGVMQRMMSESGSTSQ